MRDRLTWLGECRLYSVNALLQLKTLARLRKHWDRNKEKQRYTQSGIFSKVSEVLSMANSLLTNSVSFCVLVHINKSHRAITATVESWTCLTVREKQVQQVQHDL